MQRAEILRFAPSPTGALHLGSALSALTGFAIARHLGGRFLVRMEDTDQTRCRPELAAAILADLAWLGVSWEEPVLVQSQHYDVYRQAAARLEAMGLLYPCFASRTEILAAADPNARDPDGAPLYPRLHKGMAPVEVARRRARDEPVALRLDMDKALAAATRLLGGALLTFEALDEYGQPTTVTAQPERWGDVVIVGKERPTSYHLSVVVDDARQGVTLVTRGLDLLAATDLHRLLQVLLNLPAPRYHHHRLVLAEDGKKLSKSARDTSIADLRAAGASPADIRRLIGPIDLSSWPRR
ncbi:MAG TPA: tRNA glutamyl-Q(34) synthetase GluQRS [Hyphomicrobiaceae bacterium]|nr:tRNA glutamyl-Q(34) synthetase GluQRS [Hyphomicrobiaceae bacterium]